MSDAVATQAAYDAGHDRSDHHCLSNPCSWHPGEQRIRPRLAYPATLVTESAETLAEHEPVLGVFAGRASVVGCSCLSARDYRAAGYWAGQAGWRDHLLASGAVVDAATLADDDALVEASCRAVLHRWPVDEPIHEEDREQIRHALRALATALSERAR